LIGEVAAQRALERVWAAAGPLRGLDDVDAALDPLVLAARQSPRVADALVAALAHAAGATRRRRRAMAAPRDGGAAPAAADDTLHDPG